MRQFIFIFFVHSLWLSIDAAPENNQEALSTERAAFFEQAARQIRSEVFEQNDSLERVLAAFGPWYSHPQHRERPRVIALWGPTGTGKTSTISALRRKLKLKNAVDLDMQHFSENSGPSTPLSSLLDSSPSTIVDHILSQALAFDYFSIDYEFEGVHIGLQVDELERIPRIEVPEDLIVSLDEFQYANTIDEKGNRINREKIQPLWEILGNGGIIKIPNPRLAYFRRLMKHSDELFWIGVEKDFLEELKTKHGLIDHPTSTKLGSFFKFLRHPLTRKPQPNDPAHQELLKKLKKKANKLGTELEKNARKGLLAWIRDQMKNEPAELELDLSKALFVIMGNLDELFQGASEISSDPHQADEFHQRSKEITPHQIRAALGKIFTPKDVGRMGTNHISFLPFSNDGFTKIIHNEIDEVLVRARERGIDLHIDEKVYKRFFYEYVVPSQGFRQIKDGRPVFFDDPLSQVIFLLAKNGTLKENQDKAENHKLIDVHISLSDSKEGLIWKFLDQQIEVAIPVKHSDRNKAYPEPVATRVSFYLAAKVANFIEQRAELPIAIRAKSDVGVHDYMRIRSLSSEERLSSHFGEVLSEISWILGGYTAETLLYPDGEASMISSKDIALASRLADWASGSFSFKDFLVSTESIDRPLLLPAHSIMEKAIKHAKSVVLREQKFIRTLAKLLFEKIEANPEEIEKIYQEHWAGKKVDLKKPQANSCDTALKSFFDGVPLRESKSEIGFKAN